MSSVILPMACGIGFEHLLVGNVGVINAVMMVVALSERAIVQFVEYVR